MLDEMKKTIDDTLVVENRTICFVFWKFEKVPAFPSRVIHATVWINELTGAVKFAFLELALVCYLRLQNIEL